MINKKKKYKVDIFYHYANEYRKHLTDESEIEKIDFTEEFWYGLSDWKQQKNIVKININAPPGTGKSITAFAIGEQLLKEFFNKEFGITNIDRDQLEYSLTIRNKQIKDTVRVIDELNELGETGENSTTEQALFAYFSDVMAQRNIHTISCSPTGTTDKNTLLFLEVFSADKVIGKNHCKLFYKINTGGIEYKQLLGTVTIDVNKILRKEWYKDYRQRKFEKMNLILDEGIFQPYRLVYAGLALNIIEKLKVLTTNPRLPTTSMIRNFVKAEWSKAKMAQSLVGEINAVKDCEGILDGYKEVNRTLRQTSKLRKEIQEADTTQDTKKATELRNQIITLQRSLDIIRENINIQEAELQRYKKVNEKYNKKMVEVQIT